MLLLLLLWRRYAVAPSFGAKYIASALMARLTL
jgi:hypothetical protein